MSACPTCGKPVDALRARHVAVRDGKVTAYCSPECLASADPSKPNVAPRGRSTPAQGVVRAGAAPDSGPVIEIRYEPASGVVTSAPDTRTPPHAVKTVAEPKPEAKPEAKKPEPKPEETKPKRPSVVGESNTPTDIPPGTEPAKLSPAKISEVAAKAEGTGTSVLGPRRLGRATIKRDDANVDQAEDWIDDEPADEGVVRAGTDVSALLEEPKRGRGVLITLLVVLVLAGGVVLAYRFELFGSSSAKPSTGSVGEASGSAPGSGVDTGSNPGSGSAKRVVGPPPADDRQLSLERAISILRGYLDAKQTPRVQRVAAAALSRTRDKAAIERLASALVKDKLELANQLEFAYALARAGDQRGRAALVAATGAPRRDDKLAAGRLLVQLGDKAGADTLAVYLEVPQHRLGAAEQVARLSDARGVKVLETIHADKTAGADDKARAVIGLTLAGKLEVSDELRALLTDNHFNVYAAEALALRHDESARPVLANQLELSPLRVGAARALRLLAPERDTGEYLATLTAALDRQQRDTERIQLAEAILLLAGPARWSERM